PGSEPDDASPTDLGPWEAQTTSATLSVGDGLFPTEIPLTLFVPEGDGPFPVVVMTDGFNLAGDLYTSYGDHLSSWGYVVVLADIPNNFIFSKTAVELAEYMGATFDWIEDNASGQLGGQADISKMAIAGHSAGGKAAIHVSLYDDRSQAVFSIDPVDSTPDFVNASPEDYPSIAPELMDQLDVPVVLVGETTNGSVEGATLTPCAPLEENFQQYYAAATGPALEIEFIGASHMSFLDNPDCGLSCSVCPSGTDDPTATRVLTQGFMVAFFDHVLKGDPDAATYLTGDEMAKTIADGLVNAQWKNGF
ncbi:MAG: hypothetical protein QF464_08440, partial [Myxococcota bacterium]|nr:hypothetical protein [Myxococcota bacterium]